MKKIWGVFAITALIFCSSCSKTCNCTAKLNGEVLSESTIELTEEGERCSDHNTTVYVLGQSAELKCSAQLF
jgi:predicted RNA-binding protein